MYMEIAIQQYTKMRSSSQPQRVRSRGSLSTDKQRAAGIANTRRSKMLSDDGLSALS